MHKWKLEHMSEPYKYVHAQGGTGKGTANEAKLVQPEMVAAVTCPFCSHNKTPSKRARKVQPKLDAAFTCPFCTRNRSGHMNRAKKRKLGEAERGASGTQEPCLSSAGPSDEDMENESRPIPASSNQEPSCVSPAGSPEESKEKESRRIPESLSPSRRNGSPRRPPLVCTSSNQEPCVSSARPPDESKENESRRVPASFRGVLKIGGVIPTLRFTSAVIWSNDEVLVLRRGLEEYPDKPSLSKYISTAEYHNAGKEDNKNDGDSSRCKTEDYNAGKKARMEKMVNSSSVSNMNYVQPDNMTHNAPTSLMCTIVIKFHVKDICASEIL
ncbi:hypothetical protein OPV22_002738 [Ensete ventricosum]|uniref:Transcription elongation factor 1 homolog n=1 Tax=Ensete ventricosum TaxID=4639 RepID=A0AAV8RYZ1_ENSVE|nr:hypothetical protein OPV22_002738 [Ensete ventricosum]